MCNSSHTTLNTFHIQSAPQLAVLEVITVPNSASFLSGKRAFRRFSARSALDFIEGERFSKGGLCLRTSPDSIEDRLNDFSRCRFCSARDRRMPQRLQTQFSLASLRHNGVLVAPQSRQDLGEGSEQGSWLLDSGRDRFWLVCLFSSQDSCLEMKADVDSRE